MTTLTHNKKKYYTDFADLVFNRTRQMKYGIDSCKKSFADPILILVRKELVDWQSIEDNNILCETNVDVSM